MCFMVPQKQTRNVAVSEKAVHTATTYDVHYSWGTEPIIYNCRIMSLVSALEDVAAVDLVTSVHNLGINTDATS